MNNFNVDAIDPFSLPFVSFEYRNCLPASQGIYFGIARNKIQYIGMTDAWGGFRGRWATHHRSKEFSAFEDPRIAYLEISESLDLLDIEQSFIRRFQPPLNKTRHKVSIETLMEKIRELESGPETESTLIQLQCAKRKLWLANFIKKLKNKKTNKNLAEQIGITGTSLSDMTKGVVDPNNLNSDRWDAFCRISGVNHSDLRSEMKRFAGMDCSLAHDEEALLFNILDSFRKLSSEEKLRIIPELLVEIAESMAN